MRRGRRRTLIDRYPNGKPKRESVDQIKAVVREQRLKLVPKEHALDERAGYELGRLYLAGVISRVQFDAGTTYAKTVVEYCVAKGFPRRFPKAIDYARPHVNAYDGDDLDADEMRRVRKLEARYLDAFAALKGTGGYGQRQAVTVNSVVLDDMETANWPRHMLALLRAGLSTLAGHYGITAARRAKSQHFGDKWMPGTQDVDYGRESV